jgi:hypothetical protein
VTDQHQYRTPCCPSIEFGKLESSKAQRTFYAELNNEIVLVIKSLPASIQTRVLLELMDHLGLSVRSGMDFFKGFYTPAWSILYWLLVSFSGRRKLSPSIVNNIKTVHASAMLLHLLDDHLNDGEMAPTHLMLLLRSQLWMFMNQALKKLTERIIHGPEIVQGFFDDYYGAVVDSEAIDSLDAYCDLFKKQMATGFIAPVLMTTKMTADAQLAEAVENVYSAFGIAWRLLDDLQDMVRDLQTATKSAFYYCLPAEARRYWVNAVRSEASGKVYPSKYIAECIRDHNLIGRILNRIWRELEIAISISDTFKIKGFANELRRLRKPLISNRGFYGCWDKGYSRGSRMEPQTEY